MARNFVPGAQRWLPGKVVEKEGSVMVKVKLDDGRTWRRHVDQLIRSQLIEPGLVTSQDTAQEDMDPLTMPSEPPAIEPPMIAVPPIAEPPVVAEPTALDLPAAVTTEHDSVTPPTTEDDCGSRTRSPELGDAPPPTGGAQNNPPPTQPRRSVRTRDHPDRLGW